MNSCKKTIFKILPFIALTTTFFLKADIGLKTTLKWTNFAPIIYHDKIRVPSTAQTPSLLSIKYPRSFKYSTSFDSTGRLVTIRLQSNKLDILLPLHLSLQEYLKKRSTIETDRLWRKSVYENLKSMKIRRGGKGGITIKSPKIKSKTFKRMFGGENLSLIVNGNITIDGGLRNEKYDWVKDVTNRRPNTSFNMKQKQNFNITGKIGENVSIKVDQNSERTFEFENALKLEYKGDEDAIIQSLEAGNTTLNLPSTRFVTVNAQNSGLFGFKSKMKLGNLDITAIASMQKGEKKKKTFTGGKEKHTRKINDYEYKRWTYFFLDSLYRAQFPKLDSNGKHIIDPNKIITEIEVYKSDAYYETKKEGSFYAWATPRGDPNNPDTTKTSSEIYSGYFIRLEPNVDYFLMPLIGSIIMKMPLQDSEVLAVAYRDSSGKSYGTLISENPNSSSTPIFKLIKAKGPHPSYKTWNLEWKNVYDLGVGQITSEDFEEGFEINIYHKTGGSGNDEQAIKLNSGQTVGFLKIFGLDNKDKNGNDKSDNKIDDNPNIIDKTHGILIFPNLRPFDPDPLLDTTYPFPEEMNELRSPALYDTTVNNVIQRQSKFYIEVKSSKQSTTYDLGMNIIEGSETVTLNGRRLQKGTDYTIDYFTGTATILTEEASNPNAEIEINYESHQFVEIDKKALIGARAEYTLWENESNRSFIGGTFLYLSQQTLDRRIRLGQNGPMKNMIWDINGALHFKPDFLTSGLNLIPLLSVTGKSSVSVEGEIAQVIPNPNPLNNRATGDPDGVAYIDDFEGAIRKISLGKIRKNWGLCSQPLLKDSSKASLSTMGRLIWYNPKNAVYIKDIWPNKEISGLGDRNYIEVLTLDFTPVDTLDDKKVSWGGVQRSLSSGSWDHTESKFLEIWVKGERGRLHIDLGQISEDVIPNNKWDTEDKAPPGEFRDNNLTPNYNEDTGLDGAFGDDPPTLFYPHVSAKVKTTTKNGHSYVYCEPYDFWDINGDGEKNPDEPWSYDNFYYEHGSNNYELINGTENNERDGNIKKPDSEDLNGNGDVDLVNNYYELSFSLDLESEDRIYIAGGDTINKDGWRLYRLPLDDAEKFGTPSWSRIEFVRLWVDGVEQNTKITIAEINLTGNEWKFRGIKSELDSTYQQDDDSTMYISVVNTHDNPSYSPPPGVKGEFDPVKKIHSKEQSLVLGLRNLMPGEAAFAEKRFFKEQNFIHYKKLKMFVHGGGINSSLLESDSLEFVLQWGTDNENKIYYQAKLLKIYPGWDEEKKRNFIEVDFEELGVLKRDMVSLGQDSISKKITDNQTLSVYGQPSLTKIRWFMVGIKNKSNTPFTGEVWIDELRLSGIRKEKGLAMRVRADIKLGDFISINGEYNRKDADFHTINERFGGGSNSRQGNIYANINLHKFLPTEWGMSIPFSLNITKNTQTPKYFPGSDILVTDRTAPDSILKTIQTINKNQSFNISFSKKVKSKNPFLRYLVDPFSGRYSYTKNEMSSSQIASSLKKQRSGSIQYNLSFNNIKPLQPFKWLGTKGIFKNIASIKFYYLPKNLNIQMAGDDRDEHTLRREGLSDTVKTSFFNQKVSTSIQPFQALSLTYTKSRKSDMRGKHLPDYFSLDPGMARNKTQQFGTKFNPSLIKWLSTNFSYNANYSWQNNPSIKESGTSTRVNSDMMIRTSLNTAKMFQPGGRGKRTVRTRRRQPVTRKEPKKKEPKISEKKEKKGFSFASVFRIFGKVFKKIDPISITYQEKKSANHYGILNGADPSFAYTMGFNIEDPGVKFSDDATTQKSSLRYDKNMSLGTGFNVTSRISVKLDYKYSRTNTQSTQNTTNISKSFLVLNPEARNKGIPIPNWTIQWNGLEKLPLLSKITRSVSLNHSFSGKNSISKKGNSITNQTLSRDFRPFIQCTMTFKNGLTTTIRVNTSQAISITVQNPSTIQKTSSFDLTITARHTIKGGFRLPLLNKRIENNINFNLSFSNKHNKTRRKPEGGRYTTMMETKSWSFQPKIDYTFSKSVTGGISFLIGKEFRLNQGTKTITDFSIHANIKLSSI